jgi:acyl-CoA oxidase
VTRIQVDAGALQRTLDGEHAQVRDRVREVLRRAEFAPVSGLRREEHRAHALALAKELAREGSALLGFPPQYGGADDAGGSIAAFETIAYGDLSTWVKCGVHFGLVRGAVLYLGTHEHHERYLPGIATLELPGCIVMTEIGHGSNVQGLRTTATYDPDTQEFVIHTPDDDARKDFIGNSARDGRIGIVFARLIVADTDHGIHALIVTLRDEHSRVTDGITIEDCGDKLGLNGVDNGTISFDQLRVPREALLDRYAQVSPEGVYTSPIENANQRFFTMIGILIVGRVSIAGAALSASKSSLAIAVRHALRRRQFGPPGGEEELLLDYPTHQRRLVPALAATYALHFAQERLVAEFHRAFTEAEYPDDARRQFETAVAGLKALATWHATATIQTCRECCGGAGYMSANRFAALKADTEPFTTFEGDNTVLLQLVAKSLLTGYKDQFGELDPFGMVAFVAGQFYETLLERTAVRALMGRVVDEISSVRDDGTGALDREDQLELLRWREQHLTRSLAQRMKRGVDAGADPYSVFKSCQDHAVTMARAHVERVVLEGFDAAVARCDDDGCADVLRRLCDLYALSTIERDRGWFLEHGRLSAPRSKAVTRSVSRLCAELRDVADVLVDAFGIPDAVLAAPIAHPCAADTGTR